MSDPEFSEIPVYSVYEYLFFIVAFLLTVCFPWLPSATEDRSVADIKLLLFALPSVGLVLGIPAGLVSLTDVSPRWLRYRSFLGTAGVMTGSYVIWKALHATMISGGQLPSLWAPGLVVGLCLPWALCLVPGYRNFFYPWDFSGRGDQRPDERRRERTRHRRNRATGISFLLFPLLGILFKLMEGETTLGLIGTAGGYVFLFVIGYIIYVRSTKKGK